MERLTTRNDMGIAVLKQPYRCERCGEETWSLSDHGNGEPIDKLAEYEDLEEQGKLPRLPCAVGTTVYEIYQFLGEGAWEIDVHRIRLEDLENIGKTVFLSRGEAEAAIRRADQELTEV